jgi:hypothetical protein
MPLFEENLRAQIITNFEKREPRDLLPYALFVLFSFSPLKFLFSFNRHILSVCEIMGMESHWHDAFYRLKLKADRDVRFENGTTALPIVPDCPHCCCCFALLPCQELLSLWLLKPL